MEKVIAVVVSYNRQNLLANCIEALRNQTRRLDAILVVNNGSTDNTAAWLEAQPDLFFLHQQNIGSAGGFNTAITWAYKHGYARIWCMDDDGYPAPDALEKLIQYEPHEYALLNCAVLNIHDKKSFVWKTGNYKTIDDVNEDLIPGIAHPFNGTLLHRAIVEKVGVPKTGLFLWGDETEYYYRITKMYHFPVYTVSKSIHYHPPAAFSYKEDWNFKSSWKMYYYIRNRFHVHQAKFSSKLLAWLHYACFVLAFAGIILVFQKTDKVKKLQFIAWPVLDAIQNKFSIYPSQILKTLNNYEDRGLVRVENKFRLIINQIQTSISPNRTNKPASVG